MQAASALLRDRPYEEVTLEAIAQKAGMTRGAIYGNFKDREELFALVALQNWRPVVPRYEAGASFKALMRGLGAAYYAAAQARVPEAAAAAAFQLQTIRRPELAAQIAALYRLVRRDLTARLLEHYPQAALPMAADELIKIFGALGEGLMAAHIIEQDAYTEATFIAAFETFAGRY